MKPTCKYCMWFSGELMTCDGEILDNRGRCIDPHEHRGEVDADDWCVNFALSKWAKKQQKKQEGDE